MKKWCISLGCATGHFKPEGQMEKIKKGGFYWERELYQSKAFLSLNKNAIKILIAFMDNRQFRKTKSKPGKRKTLVCINGDNLKLPYDLFEKIYKIPRPRITPAIDELLAKGFLKISYQGGCCPHDQSVYALSDNYILWTENTEPFEIRRKGGRKGYQGSKI